MPVDKSADLLTVGADAEELGLTEAKVKRAIKGVEVRAKARRGV